MNLEFIYYDITATNESIHNQLHTFQHTYFHRQQRKLFFITIGIDCVNINNFLSWQLLLTKQCITDISMCEYL